MISPLRNSRHHPLSLITGMDKWATNLSTYVKDSYHSKDEFVLISTIKAERHNGRDKFSYEKTVIEKHT
ncbi:10687_t:CDS:2 [Funneliformis caledonium]|uniref:10687_t:CDS:1 n=1 Tax=Funneliformis caledonium TaxID=1117310 RepID=A0A9N9IA16_9GLOM|nr:10687_t:CDS:2 [Funneliformis caledonium]